MDILKSAMNEENPQFNDCEKIEIYRFLMQNGFGSLDPVKLKESSLRDYSVEDIRKFLDAYKNYRSDDDDQFRNLMLKIFDSFTNTKSVEFVSIFSNLMLHKCSNLPLDSEYREVYLFLAKLLKGELPNIQNLKPKSTSILLALIQEIQLLVDSIEAKDVERIFAKNDQVNLEKSSHEEIPEERREKLMKTLMTMFKFQKISHFLNPLKIPHEVNRELMGYFLKKVA